MFMYEYSYDTWTFWVEQIMRLWDGVKVMFWLEAFYLPSQSGCLFSFTIC